MFLLIMLFVAIACYYFYYKNTGDQQSGAQQFGAQESGAEAGAVQAVLTVLVVTKTSANNLKDSLNTNIPTPDVIVVHLSEDTDPKYVDAPIELTFGSEVVSYQNVSVHRNSRYYTMILAKSLEPIDREVYSDLTGTKVAAKILYSEKFTNLEVYDIIKTPCVFEYTASYGNNFIYSIHSVETSTNVLRQLKTNGITANVFTDQSEHYFAVPDEFEMKKLKVNGNVGIYEFKRNKE